MSFSILKKYLRLVLENDAPVHEERLLSAKDAQLLISDALKFQITKIADSIIEYELIDFISLYPLKRLGANEEIINFFTEIKAMDFSAEDALEQIAFNVTISSPNVIIDRKPHYKEEELEKGIENQLAICSRARNILTDLIEKIEADDMASVTGSDYFEAPADAPLGRIAFPTLRDDVPFEKNTAVETNLQSAIYAHIIHNKPIRTNDAVLIKDFIQRNFYSNIFGEPDTDLVYRGMSVTKDYIANILGVEQIAPSGEVEVDWDFTPLSQTSSWTIDDEVAIEEFSGKTDRNNISLLMTAKVDENSGKFVDFSKLYSMKSFREYSNEQEVVGVGNIKIFKIWWW
jgi:hypothetical protein